MNITQQQASARFRILPEPLQDIIFSVQTSEIIRRIAEQNHLSQEKIGGVAETAGFVLLGFLHPEEAAKEIRERSGIDMQIAKTIADALDSRLFRPIRGELDQLYAPVPHEGEAPTIIHEVKKPEMGERVVRLDSLRVEGGSSSSFAPRPPSIPTPMPPAPTVSSGPTTTTPPKPQTTAPFPAPSTPAGPPPIIIHQESAAEPIKRSGPISFGSANQLDSIKTEIKVPPRPANIEIGGAWPPKSPIEKPVTPPPKPISEPPRAVHYGQFKTPLEEKKIAVPQVPPAGGPPVPMAPSGPTPTVSSGPPNLPTTPITTPQTIISKEKPNQKQFPPQGIMPQAKPQAPAFLPKPNLEQATSAAPAQKITPKRTLPKPPSPPAPIVSSAPMPTAAPPKPAGAPLISTLRPSAAPPPPISKPPLAPPPAPTMPSGQAGGPAVSSGPTTPQQSREPIVDLDTLKEKSAG